MRVLSTLLLGVLAALFAVWLVIAVYPTPDYESAKGDMIAASWDGSVEGFINHPLLKFENQIQQLSTG
ncbi:MAG: hypothetical protein ACE149_07380 [Armatimonadota bacterium]